MASSNEVSYLHGYVDIYNTDDLNNYHQGIIQFDEVKVLRNIRVELDTGSKHVVLTPEHERALVPAFSHMAQVTPITSTVPTATPVVGPVTVLMSNKIAEVMVHRLPHVPRTMIGFEAAAKLRLQLDWRKCEFYVPMSQLDRATNTDDARID